MPREFAKAWFSMFTDDDFVQQDHGDKWLYLTLLGQPALNYAGIQPINWRRWQRAMREMSGRLPSERELQARLNRMESRRFVFTDPETGEVLTRTFMRSDGIARQPNVMKSGLRSLAHVESPKLAAILVSELDELDVPVAWSEKAAAEVASLRESARHHLVRLSEGLAEPFPEPFPEGLAEGLAEPFDLPDSKLCENGRTEGFPEPFPEGLAEGSVQVQVQVQPTDPATQVGKFACASANEPASTSDQASVTDLDHEPPTRCAEHRDLPADTHIPPCGPCANFRKAHERWQQRSDTAARAREHERAAERREERQARANNAREEITMCQLCDESGMRIDRAEWCDHKQIDTTAARTALAEMRATLAKKETA